MPYLSTRGRTEPVSSAMAIKLGLAPDGGLFLPDSIPSLTTEDLAALANLPYAELTAAIVRRFLPDYDPAALGRMTASAYGPDRFDTEAVAPLVPLTDRDYLLELWHGPTAAFKDMALQLMPHLLTEAMTQTQERGEIVILVATSGDTGKAALEGFRNVPGTRIIVFYPAHGVSRVQELQMVTQEGANTGVVAVEGNFDDAQNGVKAIFGDKALAAAMARRSLYFSSANSINWGRLVPQVAYYVWAYLQLTLRARLPLGTPIVAAVPTGNFGNILAAYYARAMGVPLARLVCASNQNKVLTDFIRTGLYDRRRTFYTTVSPSMDILISSNLERLLFLLAGREAGRVRDWMTKLNESGSYQVEMDVLSQMQEVFWAGFADEEQTRATIGNTYEERGYLLDTHTAVGVHVLEEYRRATGDRTPAVIASTASPFKFGRAVLQALAGEEAVAGRDDLELLEVLAQRTGLAIPKGLRGLESKTVRHQSGCAKEEMRRQVEEMLGLG